MSQLDVLKKHLEEISETLKDLAQKTALGELDEDKWDDIKAYLKGVANANNESEGE